MSKFITVQTNVPICPECSGKLVLRQITNEFKCHQCGYRLKVVGMGKTDRELICEVENSLHNHANTV